MTLPTFSSKNEFKSMARKEGDNGEAPKMGLPRRRKKISKEPMEE